MSYHLSKCASSKLAILFTNRAAENSCEMEFAVLAQPTSRHNNTRQLDITFVPSHFISFCLLFLLLQGPDGISKFVEDRETGLLEEAGC